MPKKIIRFWSNYGQPNEIHWTFSVSEKKYKKIQELVKSGMNIEQAYTEVIKPKKKTHKWSLRRIFGFKVLANFLSLI